MNIFEQVLNQLHIEQEELQEKISMVMKPLKRFRGIGKPGSAAIRYPAAIKSGSHKVLAVPTPQKRLPPMPPIRPGKGVGAPGTAAKPQHAIQRPLKRGERIVKKSNKKFLNF